MGKNLVKELSSQDREYIRVVHSNTQMSWDSRMNLLKNKFDRSERTIRKWIKKLGFAQNKSNSKILSNSQPIKYKSKYIIITSAQNATPVHKEFWENILSYADYHKADVGVIPFLYGSNKEDNWWDESIKDYLDDTRQEIHKYLSIVGDLRILPTASDPLNNIEGITGGKSTIIAHPRVHSVSLPVLEGHHKKNMMTTGTCTLRNYTNSKAGKIAEFHHTFSFIFIELKDNEVFYARQVTANDDGSFIDLFFEVNNKKVSKISNVSAAILGDIHTDCLEEDIMSETMRYLKIISPEKIILHDLINGTPVNHHEFNDPILQYQKYKNGSNLIKNEINGLDTFIKKYKLLNYDTYVVKSNHEAFYERYIAEQSWKKDIPNALEYMEFTHALLSGKAPNGILAYILSNLFGEKIKCLTLDDSLVVMDWELAQHGHLGANGSKGGIEQNRKLNTKIITGHIHSPYRKDGSIGVGTFTKIRQSYMHGPSSHNWAFALVHCDGKSQLIVFSNDKKFTTLF